MGLETICLCRVGAQEAEAKILLESHELILRAPFRRTISVADIKAVNVAGSALTIEAGDIAICLELGEVAAAKWAKKILSPPPSLASKLGIGHAKPAFVIGDVHDAELAEALQGHSAPASRATLSVAIVDDAATLDAALAAHRALPARSHIWIVYRKGPTAAFGDGAVRARMRSLGYRDSKTSAVSNTLSATRYSLG